METTDSSQSLEEREAELCITAAWLSSNLESLSKIARKLSVKADKLATERRAFAKRGQSKARMGKDMETDQRQKLVRDLKASSSFLNTAADSLLLVSESPEEETSTIIIDLVQRAKDLIDGTELLKENQD